MKKATTLSRICSSVLDLAYPSKCALCGLLAPAVCTLCRSEFMPFTHELHLQQEDPLSELHVLFEYEGRAGQAVRRLKYARSTSLIEPLSEEIAQAVIKRGFDGVDAIVPVPIHWTRRCQRGFNQVELLCERLPAHLVAPNLLRRTRSGPPQASLRPDQRLANIAGAFNALPAVAGKEILLIDDVLTSGQTLRECAKALKSEGARSVFGLTLTG